MKITRRKSTLPTLVVVLLPRQNVVPECHWQKRFALVMQILIVILIFTFWFWLKFRLEVLLVSDHLSKVEQLCVPASIINVWNLSFKIFIEIWKLMILWINFPKSPNFEDLWFNNRTSKLLSDLPWSQFLAQTTVTSRGASSILKTKESSQSRITRQENLKEIRDNS